MVSSLCRGWTRRVSSDRPSVWSRSWRQSCARTRCDRGPVAVQVRGRCMGSLSALPATLGRGLPRRGTTSVAVGAAQGRPATDTSRPWRGRTGTGPAGKDRPGTFHPSRVGGFWEPGPQVPPAAIRVQSLPDLEVTLLHPPRLARESWGMRPVHGEPRHRTNRCARGP